MSPRPYEFPKDPSPQVEVIRKYYASLRTFDLDNLSTLTTDDSTHKVAPSSLVVPDMTKNVFLTYLGQLQADIKGQHLDVSRTQMTQRTNRQSARQYTLYDINDGVGKTWVHVPRFYFLRIDDPILISRRSSRRSWKHVTLKLFTFSSLAQGTTHSRSLPPRDSPTARGIRNSVQNRKLNPESLNCRF